MTSLALAILSDGREYLVIVGVLFAICVVCSLALLAFLVALRRLGGRSVPDRIRYPREPKIDLGRERDEFERQREAREEAELLRRVA